MDVLETDVAPAHLRFVVNHVSPCCEGENRYYEANRQSNNVELKWGMLADMA